MPVSKTIDASTKVNLGILITLISAVGAGGWWCSDVQSTIESVDDRLGGLQTSVERLVEADRVNSREVAVLRELVRSLEKRLALVETGR